MLTAPRACHSDTVFSRIPTGPETAVNKTERITISPESRCHETPVLFLHGMWHGAWVWEQWQARFAGRGASPAQGSVRISTMGRYLDVLREQVAEITPKPVFIGASMGGALIQWYLKKVADDLPAAVILAGWSAHSMYADGVWPFLRRDPWGALTTVAALSSWPLVRNPRRAAQSLLSPGSKVDAAALHARLCRESALVLNQHNPPFWWPKRTPKTPLFWVAGEADAVITEKGARRAAAFYGADYHLVPDDGHNLMMEKHEADTARAIHDWLERRGLP